MQQRVQFPSQLQHLGGIFLDSDLMHNFLPCSRRVIYERTSSAGVARLQVAADVLNPLMNDHAQLREDLSYFFFILSSQSFGAQRRNLVFKPHLRERIERDALPAGRGARSKACM